MQIPFVSSRGIKNHGYWRRGKREPVAFNKYILRARSGDRFVNADEVVVEDMVRDRG